MRKKLILVILMLTLVCMNLCLPAFAAIDTTSAPSTLINVDSVALSGVTMGVSSDGFLESLPSGYASYNGHILPQLPSLASYVYIYKSGSYYWAEFSSIPFVAKSVTSAAQIAVSSTSKVTLYDYKLHEDYLSNGWQNDGSWSVKYASGLCYGQDYIWSNHDIVFDYSLYASAGGSYYSSDYDGFVVFAGTAPVISGSVCVEKDISFPASDFTKKSVPANNLQELSTSSSVSGAVEGEVTASYSIDDPYVDFIWEKSVDGMTADGMSVDGSFLMKYMLGLRLLGNTNDNGVMYKTDLFPVSCSVLVNGEPVGDQIPVQGSFDPVAGIHQSPSGSDGMQPFDGSDTQVDFSDQTFSFERTEVDTVGLRFYFDTPLGLSDVSMSVGTFSTDNISAYGAFRYLLYSRPIFSLTGLESVDPDPEPTDTTDPDPEPTDTTDPDPEPTDTTDPDPGPTDTTDPDPDPTDTMDPEPEPSFDSSGMGLLGGTITGAVNLFKLEFTLFGFTFSLWQVLLFDVIASIIIWFVWRFLL